MKFSLPAVRVALLSSGMAALRLAAAENAICSTCPTLRSLYDDHIKGTMPTSGSDDYVAPSEAQLNDMDSVVRDMMAGTGCAGVDLRSLDDKYDIGVFTDAGNGKSYCVLVAKSKASAWSNVFVNEDPAAKDLSIDTAHPFWDGTDEQTVAIFAGTNAKSMVISGSHRKGSNVDSLCDGTMSAGVPYRISDAAHVIGGFQYAYKAIMDHYDALDTDYTAIQLHGMGATSCVSDAHLTNGNSVVPNPNEKVDILRDAIDEVFDGLFTVPGDEPYCGMTGGTNTGGRMLNGVPLDDACEVAATAYTGRFLHVETKGPLRDSSDAVHDGWIEAINAAYAAFPNADAPRNIALTGPNGGQTIAQGSLVPVTWAFNGIDPADLFQVSVGTRDEEGEYGYGKGIAWGGETGPFAAASDGGCEWRVHTSLEPGEYVVRIRGVEETNVLDYSDETFTVVEAYDITYPDGGQTISWGDTFQITWDTSVAGAAGMDTVKLALCTGPDHAFYGDIAVEVANTGSFEWTIPVSVVPGDEYTVRVWNTEYTSSADYSDDYFSIAGGSIEVGYPNGGQTVAQGTHVPIEWTTSGAIPADDDLQISVGKFDAEGTYEYVMGIAYGSSSYPYANASDLSYDWTIRTALAEGNYIMRIKSQSSTVRDYSDSEFAVVNPFKITFPNGGGGQTFEVKQEITITWDVRAAGVDTVKLSLHKGITWYKNIATVPNTGSHTWTFPSWYQLRSDYKVRVRNVDYTASYAFSESSFSLVGEGEAARALRGDGTVSN